MVTRQVDFPLPGGQQVFNKFSQHIIVGVGCDGYLGTMQQVASVVRNVCDIVQHMDECCVLSHDSIKHCITDRSVYNKNQQFSVLFSSKYAQQRPLVPLNDSAITLQTVDWELYKQSLVVVQAAKVDHFAHEHHRSITCSSRVVSSSGVYPLLEQHIQSQLHDGERITSVAWCRQRPFEVPKMYYSTSSKFCSNIMRQHKSNHIMVHVDVVACKLRWYCLDPCCAKGNWVAFDKHMIGAVDNSSGQQWHDHWARWRE